MNLGKIFLYIMAFLGMLVILILTAGSLVRLIP